MTEIPDRPFDKIAIDLVTNCKTSTSGNKHILIIIDHLTAWPEAFPIPDNSADTIVATFINEYLLVHMCPQYILPDNGTEFKNSLMDQVVAWLDDMDERKYMMDKEILDKCIDLKDSCLDKIERKQVMEMLYKYKDVFSLRDEIGTCPKYRGKYRGYR